MMIMYWYDSFFFFWRRCIYIYIRRFFCTALVEPFAYPPTCSPRTDPPKRTIIIRNTAIFLFSFELIQYSTMTAPSQVSSSVRRTRARTHNSIVSHRKHSRFIRRLWTRLSLLSLVRGFVRLLLIFFFRAFSLVRCHFFFFSLLLFLLLSYIFIRVCTAASQRAPPLVP